MSFASNSHHFLDLPFYAVRPLQQPIPIDTVSLFLQLTLAKMSLSLKQQIQYIKQSNTQN